MVFFDNAATSYQKPPGVYRAMRFCVEGNTEMFTATLLHTVGFAAALSVGAMLASSLVRALLPRFPRKKT